MQDDGRRPPDDWSDPEKHTRMSAAVPLIFLAVPLIAALLWGLLGG